MLPADSEELGSTTAQPQRQGYVARPLLWRLVPSVAAAIFALLLAWTSRARDGRDTSDGLNSALVMHAQRTKCDPSPGAHLLKP